MESDYGCIIKEQLAYYMIEIILEQLIAIFWYLRKEIFDRPSV
jgi:hypothetical protein